MKLFHALKYRHLESPEAYVVRSSVTPMSGHVTKVVVYNGSKANCVEYARTQRYYNLDPTMQLQVVLTS